MSGFGKYLKDYLEYNNISQSEFASRLNISQKHMNEILNGKADITLEMAASIEKLTDISISFIINSENRKLVTRYILEKYNSEEELQKIIKEEFFINELSKMKWIDFKDITNPIQNYMDLVEFLKVKNLEALSNIQEKTLFKKTGENINKLNLWIARCDELAKNQTVKEYVPAAFNFLIEDLKKECYSNFNIDKIQQILNEYGIYFIVEKALSGTKVRGCFKVKGKQPAIYITQNYVGKDSFFFELFHELGHCKSDYNEAKNKVIVEGEKNQEERADLFALNTMIPKNVWKEIENNYDKSNLLEISNKNKIPMSFIVGRLAKEGKIKYNSKLYNDYKLT
jgi:HTH-type transcriptional regulator/antitoxin HigA